MHYYRQIAAVMTTDFIDGWNSRQSSVAYNILSATVTTLRLLDSSLTRFHAIYELIQLTHGKNNVISDR